MSGRVSSGVRPFKAFSRKAALRIIRRAPIELIPKWHIVTGDTVAVLSGRGVGKTGVVRTVLRKENRLIVAGVNFVKRHVRPTERTAGGVVAMESPIHYSNVNLVDPTVGKPTRIAIKYTEAGEKVRVSKRTGAIIPWPPTLKALRRAIRHAEPGIKDTPLAVVKAATYVPPPALAPYLSAPPARSSSGGGSGSVAGAAASASGAGAAISAAASVSLWRRRTRTTKAGKPLRGESRAPGDAALPRFLRTAKLRRKVRLDERRKWSAAVSRKRLDADVAALVDAAAGAGGGGGGGIATLAAAASAAGRSAVAAGAELR